jgi:hypothetical protein
MAIVFYEKKMIEQPKPQQESIQKSENTPKCIIRSALFL